MLYYGGWASVLSLLLTIACLVLVLVKILGIKNGRIHKNWLIYATAVAMLTDRAVFGTLYGFGIPFPVALPFLGKTGIMDSMAFTLILFGAWENLQIQKNMHLDDTFVSAESLLGSLDSYQILDEDNEIYEEERSVYLKPGIIIFRERDLFLNLLMSDGTFLTIRRMKSESR